VPGADEVHSRARSFDAAAEAYERGRPGWPPEAIEIAARRLGLERGAAVLDLAAGTGKLTRRLAGRFGSVTAVEPLAGMRAVLEERIPFVRVLAGTAEAIPLGDASVDAVFVAEAIHWFDPAAAVAEIARVLRPRGGAAVLYNRLDWQDEATSWRAEADVAVAHGRLRADRLEELVTVRVGGVRAPGERTVGHAQAEPGGVEDGAAVEVRVRLPALAEGDAQRRTADRLGLRRRGGQGERGDEEEDPIRPSPAPQHCRSSTVRSDVPGVPFVARPTHRYPG